MKITAFIAIGLLLSSLSSLATAEESATSSTTANKAPTENAEEFVGFKRIQPEVIHLTIIEFRKYDKIKELQERIRGIPGVSDFIPYLETPGLITYDLRYSGSTPLLYKAMEETLAEFYELAMKEMGDKAYEITIRQK